MGFRDFFGLGVHIHLLRALQTPEPWGQKLLHLGPFHTLPCVPLLLAVPLVYLSFVRHCSVCVEGVGYESLICSQD